MIKTKDITEREVVDTYLKLREEEIAKRRKQYHEPETDTTIASLYSFLLKQDTTEDEFATRSVAIPLGHKLSEKYPWKVVARKLDKLERYMEYRGGFGELYGFVTFKDEYLSKFV